MDIFEKELDVLEAMYESAELNECDNVRIFVESDQLKKFSKAVGSVKEKMAKRLERVHTYYHSLRVHVEKNCVNAKISHLSDKTLYKIALNAKDVTTAINAKKILDIQKRGIKELNDILAASINKMAVDSVEKALRESADKTINELRDAAAEIMNDYKKKSSVDSNVKTVRKNELVKILHGYQNAYTKLNSKLERDAISTVEHLYKLSDKKYVGNEKITNYIAEYNEWVMSNATRINETVGTETTRIFNAVTKSCILGATGDFNSIS